MKQQVYLRNENFPTILCPGCGHGIVLAAMLRGIAKAGLAKNEIVLVSGIGCASRTTGYVDFQTLHTTHGRALTFATGVAVARPELKVIVVMGDGDATAIGGNHFIHAARRNVNLTAVVFNNHIYGMTGGQTSPTTPMGSFASTSPFGNFEPPFDIVALAAAAGAPFVARGTCTEPNKLEQILLKAFRTKGFSVVEAMSTCPTTYGPRNRLKTIEAYMDWLRDRCYDLGKRDKLSPEERDGRWACGTFVDEPRPHFTERYDREIATRAVAEIRLPAAIQARAHAMPPGKHEVIIAGKAGQGIQKLGAILAECVLCDGNHAAQIENYGPAARTGISLTEVVASGETIDFPLVENGTVLLAMTREALEAQLPRVSHAPQPCVIVDSTHVPHPPRGAYSVPLTAAARELDLPVAANIVLLGAYAAISQAISLESASEVIARTVHRSAEKNLAALRRGWALGTDARPVGA